LFNQLPICKKQTVNGWSDVQESTIKVQMVPIAMMQNLKMNFECVLSPLQNFIFFWLIQLVWDEWDQ